MRKPLACLLLLLWLLLPAPAMARPEMCETAAAAAALESGVPPDVLLAIALTETGRRQEGRLRPWPWAANAGGQGHWFDTRDEALAYARQLLNRGQTLFDLGCFQINWHWHGEHFARVEDLLDPLTSARYAARFLSELHGEFGSWDGAAGAYHSRTPQLAETYRTRFAQMRAELRHQPLPALPPGAPGRVRINTYPLLAAGSPVAGALRPAGAGGSLFPAALPPATPLIEAAP